MLLQSIWFYLWGLLWALFFVTDGFDFGIGTLYPFLGRTNNDRRIMLNAMGPLWDGNEVWLITAGGVTFAAFPLAYSIMFSALYTPLMLILFALILRGVSFEFRNQVDHPTWRRVWDAFIFLGSFLPALLFGVAFANIFMGIPIDQDGVNQGTLLTLLNPYGLLGGVLFVLLFLQHGALWLAIRSEGELHQRAVAIARVVWPLLLVVAIIFLIASGFATPLYDNYFSNPLLFLIILGTVGALAGVWLYTHRQQYIKAWSASALTIIGATFFGIVGLFPNIIPSSLNSAFNLTARNSSSSQLTLTIMLVVVAIFIPIVLAYQFWSYRLFMDKITEQDLELEEHY